MKILRETTDQKAVLKFYAHLFDMEIPADIFLENIRESLRNPHNITVDYINNEERSNTEREEALKALAMISPVINPSLLLKIITTERSSEVRQTAFKIIKRSPVSTYIRLTDTIMDIVCGYKLQKVTEAQSSENTQIKFSETIESQISKTINRETPESKTVKPELLEAMEHFKAAVISSHKKQFHLNMLEQQCTLDGLINRVRRDIPELMPLILNEIASFSRIAFCFIQEMAEDPSGTIFLNSDIEHALICGMIRKRPERVLKILEVYLNHPIPEIRVALARLIGKINNSLAEEKNELKRQFDQLIADSTPARREKEKTGFFKNLFATSLEQKIVRLKEANSPTGVDLKGEVIEDVDLSSCMFLSPGIFTGCIIKDVDLSLSTFEDCVFKNTFFYNVKMHGTVFFNSSFEQSVLIDVMADGANFNGCNFAGASFLNSSFKSANMIETVMAGCTIVRTSFSETDLSGATFVSSQITMVSFADTKLEKTDFSGVTGKSCRFSAHTLSRAETEQTDLYSRIIEIAHTDIDKELLVISQDQSLMNEIRMLVFTELIQQGKNMFVIKNRYAIIRAFDLFQPEQADLFELIPLLLHENIDLYTPSSRSSALAKLVELDGTVRLDGKPAGIQNYDIPHGIAGYLPNSETEKICRKYFDKRYLHKDGMIFIERPFCYIEALFTIGSIGSIAHTMGSDIDYWVCIREDLFDADKLNIFRKKLNAIEVWAQNEFKTEIHFFIVDIEKARKSDFGNSDSESSGSAQGRLLKEEFYRTMIHIAGKLPFWATLPVDVCKNYYHDLFIRVCPNPIKGRFIDFGDIHDIPAGEYFGASVWQMFKYLKSPFKSVLKMGLIEKYIYEKESNRRLLCNEFKNEWMTPGMAFNLTKADPYYILLSSLVIYYKKISKKHPFAKFVQSCFFSKVNITDEKELKKSAFGLKEILIKKCMDEWGWKQEDVFIAGDFNNWPYEKIFSESVKIKQYMVQTYKQCRRVWVSSSPSFEKESFLTPRDRTVLGRKMIVQFSMDQKAKVESILLISKTGLSSGLSLEFKDDLKSNHNWLLMHKWRDKKRGVEKNELLKKAVSIEDVGAWLIHNKLYVQDNYIKLLPNPTFVKSNDIKILFKAMHDFFANEIKKEVSNDDLCSKSTIHAMFISLNFTAPRDSKTITEWSAIYRNSWGEMFCHLFTDSTGLRTSSEVLDRIKKDLDLAVIPEKLKVFLYSQLRQ
ncbi:MAG: class I adenylate cyclase [Desulfamplus sp.]|nr:class I adenylate cyclase [Desulfamplus sp.]